MLGVGQTGKLKAKLLPSGTAGQVRFTSSNKAVAVVNAKTGQVTAKAAGTTTIKAKAFNGKSASVTLKVTRAPGYVVLSNVNGGDVELDSGTHETRYRLALAKGKTFQLKACVEYTTLGSITGYSSSDPTVATVSSKGLITAKAIGIAQITVTATGGAKAVLDLSVYGDIQPEQGTLAFETDTVTLAAGESVAAPALKGTYLSQLELLNASYASSDNRIAISAPDDADDTRRVIIGLREGTAVITATLASGATATLTVNVTHAQSTPEDPDNPASGLHFLNSSATLTAGETLTPKLRDGAGQDVEAELTSSNESVAIINGAMIHAEGPGSAVITARYEGQTAKLKLTVNARITAIVFETAEATICVGETFRLKATADSNAPMTYTSSVPSIARVNSAGVVTGLKKGRATITVSADDVFATCEVKVNSRFTKLVLSPKAADVKLAQGTATLMASFGADDEIGLVTFSSSNTAVATVPDEAMSPSEGKVACPITLTGAGTVIITAVTDNGLSTTAQLTVLEELSRYRLFTACGYAMPDYTGKGRLPFTLHNTKVIRKLFGASSLNYQIAGNVVNPSRATLGSALKSFAAASRDDDVSIIYLCTHGHYEKLDGSTQKSFYLSLPVVKGANVTFEKVTSADLMAALTACRGKVVLILSSCYSGYFIDDQLSALDAQGGRISVLAAAATTRASYYKTSDVNVSVDFFSNFIYLGIGYDGLNNCYIKDAKFNRGVAPGYMVADSTDAPSKKDGVVTLTEMYTYAQRCIAKNIPQYVNNSWYWGDPNGAQQTKWYPGNNAGLMIFRPQY